MNSRSTQASSSDSRAQWSGQIHDHKDVGRTAGADYGSSRIPGKHLNGNFAELKRQIGVVPEGMAPFGRLSAAVIHWTKVVFLDEPFEGMDAVLRTRESSPVSDNLQVKWARRKQMEAPIIPGLSAPEDNTQPNRVPSGRMNRRRFISSTGLATLALGTPERLATAAIPPKSTPPLMKLGCQSAPTNDVHLKFLARYGVRNICGYPEIADGRVYATVEELSRMKDLAAKNSIEIDCLGPPILESSYIDNEKHPAIMLAQGPERDRDIESIQKLIRNCAQVGLPSIKYNMSILGVLRTGRAPGRGDATYSQWKLSEAHPKTPLTIAGHVDADMFWERITYFLDRVIPVANEYKIRMACHPQDPGVPPEGYQGVDRVLGTVDGLKRFITIRESPYHGLNFCQGTVSEMLAEPGTQIYDVIRYFGSRQKIFNVHFRNIRGHRNDFVEVYPDEGDVDLVKAIHVYREVGYPYMLMPDHVPQASSDPNGLQSFAFCYGYIRGLMQSLEQA